VDPANVSATPPPKLSEEATDVDILFLVYAMRGRERREEARRKNEEGRE